MALTNTQYKELMRAYDEKQLRRRRLIEQRTKQLYQDAPRLLEIRDEITALGIESAKRNVGGDMQAAEDFRKQRDALAAEREAILSSMRLPADYLDPPYDCPDCRDTGYIGTTPCRCFKQAAIELVYAQSRLKELLKTENFSRFSCAQYSRDDIDPLTGKSAYDLALNAKSRCEAFAREFGHSDENLLLTGDTGLGKTLLSCAIAKELLDRGYSVLYFSAAQLFDLFTANAYRRGADPPEEYQNIFRADLVIVDDLGTEVPNTWTVSQFFTFLNERLTARKPVVISTNLSVNDLAGVYSERIFSRITKHFTMLRLYGKDIRITGRLSSAAIHTTHEAV